eukprot:TRINITY_DN6807_c0_g1_i1.p1 TRINITY_DN6807_c0_g1~~TRINITY_DN6807_c0_g1_i1.p1  ORF type:complete len:363 (-),score=72.55 TRINITY_DN6807_c0_g1_i1:17-1105(-)
MGRKSAKSKGDTTISSRKSEEIELKNEKSGENMVENEKEHAEKPGNDRELVNYLLNYSQLPMWLKFNEFIRTGYRPPGLSMRQLWASLFQIHNETGNVWTHLISFAFFFIWGSYYLFFNLWNETFACRFFFFVFWISLMWCFVSSTGYHLFSCQSERTMVCVSRLDYTGISGLILGSTIIPVFYAFYCQPFWQITYLTSISTLGLSGIVGSFFEFFHADSFSTIRTILFASTAAIGVVPLTHSIYLPRMAEVLEAIELIDQNGIHLRLFLMLSLYGLGFVVYVTKFPERLFPGKFDLWFNSHQFWHIFVFAAATVHAHNLLNIYAHWNSHGRKCEALEEAFEEAMSEFNTILQNATAPLIGH